MLGKVSSFVVVVALALPGTHALAGPKHAREVTVAKDPAGDWASDINAALAPLGESLGQDLVAARIAAHPTTIDFSIATTSMSEESARSGVYAWDMRVGGKWWRLVNFVCDPTQYVTGAAPAPVEAPESCVPDGGGGMYFEVMECGAARVVNVFANCAYRSSIEAVVDTANATLTIPVPKELMGIRSGTVIAPMEESGGSIDSGPLLPYGSATAFPADVMTWKKAYRVP